MTLLSLLIDITLVVLLLVLFGLLTIVRLDTIRAYRPHAFTQIRLAFPYLLVLGGVLLLNDYLRDVGTTISWIIGWEITTLIEDIEGDFVMTLQSYAHPWLTQYLSFIYIYGYIFLLVFPLVAYLIHQQGRPIRELTLAYALNYGIGVCFYILFIAYGPRNSAMLAEPFLYTLQPRSMILTSEVNTNVNVFPSLHTSLAMTVAILAYRWRTIYWSWFPIAGLLAFSVAFSTMYLGIHWATDVVAGIALALFSVAVAVRLTRPEIRESRMGHVGVALRRPLDRRFDYLHQRIVRSQPPESTRVPPDAISRIQQRIVLLILSVWLLFFALFASFVQLSYYRLLTGEDPVVTFPGTGFEFALVYPVIVLTVATAVVIVGLLARSPWGWWGAMALSVGLTAVFGWILLVAETNQLLALSIIAPAAYVILTLWDERHSFDLNNRFSKAARNQ